MPNNHTEGGHVVHARLTTDEIMARVRAELGRRDHLLAAASTGAAEQKSPSVGLDEGLLWRPAAPRIEPKQRYRLAELLCFDDADFVEVAYQVLLRRPSDGKGFAQYLKVLRGGWVSKVEILGSMRFSDEGRKCGVHVDGLLLPYKLRLWRRKRVVGPLLGFAMGISRLPRLAFRLQAMEANAARESQEVGLLVNRLTSSIADDMRTLRTELETLQRSVESQASGLGSMTAVWDQRRDAILEKVSVRESMATSLLEEIRSRR